MHKILLPALFSLLASNALAAPALRAEISVNRPVVTVGDMFEDAGLLAERALFRAPAPGTSGIVSLQAVRSAAVRAGLLEYSQEGILSVRVERQAAIVDATTLNDLIEADLSRRGLIGPGVEVETRFDVADISIRAENVAEPATLTSLGYQPGAGHFSARFNISGHDMPVELSGRIELMVEVPHLAASLAAGATITAGDLEMKRVPLQFADTSGVERFDQIVGKQLRRASRAGVMLKAADLSEPLAVRRNTQVTVLLRSGPMTLSVLGQSLGDATAGQIVQVMNSVSRKIVSGVANADGSVEVTTAAAQLKVAGL